MCVRSYVAGGLRACDLGMRRAEVAKQLVRVHPWELFKCPVDLLPGVRRDDRATLSRTSTRGGTSAPDRASSPKYAHIVLMKLLV